MLRTKNGLDMEESTLVKWSNEIENVIEIGVDRCLITKDPDPLSTQKVESGTPEHIETGLNHDLIIWSARIIRALQRLAVR